MTPEEIAALYEAAEGCGEPRFALAIVRALGDPVFAADVRAMLEAPPETRTVLRRILSMDGPMRAANA